MKSLVDYRRGAGYFPRIRVLSRSIAGVAPLAAVVLLACAARGGMTMAPADPAVAEAAIRSNSPNKPLWIAFDWEAREREARYTGQGAARVQPPEAARLDLFGPRGESYLSAAIVDDEVRLPPSADGSLIPPPALLWGALGIFHPPAGAELTATSSKGDRQRLEYRAGAERWDFEFQDERLRRVEWNGPNGSRKSVELKGLGELDLPREAVYRDWNEFTELKLKVDKAEVVDTFPSDIWIPHAH